MSSLNQGRNEIRVNNSNAKCLLENWVEERQVAHLDTGELGGNITSHAQIFKDGHTGVLTTKQGAPVDNLTTVRATYTPPQKCPVRTVGSKQEMMEKMLYAKVSQEVHQDFNPPPEPTDFRSMKMKDYDRPEFQSVQPAPTRPHDIKNEQPVTFWTEHRDKIHGVSASKAHIGKTGDTPFRKNDAFSKPIDEYLDQTMPHDLENYPKM